MAASLSDWSCSLFLTFSFSLQICLVVCMRLCWLLYNRLSKHSTYLSKMCVSFMHRHLFKALIMPWLIFVKEVINKSSHRDLAVLIGPQMHNKPFCPSSFSKLALKFLNLLCVCIFFPLLTAPYKQTQRFNLLIHLVLLSR